MTNAPADAIARLVAALEAGPTPGPWEVETLDGYVTGRIVRSDAHAYAGNTVSRQDSVTGEESMTACDAYFIAACREGVPALLARVAELERDCKRLRESLEYIPWIAKEGRAKPENKLDRIARYARSRSRTGGHE